MKVATAARRIQIPPGINNVMTGGTPQVLSLITAGTSALMKEKSGEPPMSAREGPANIGTTLRNKAFEKLLLFSGMFVVILLLTVVMPKCVVSHTQVVLFCLRADGSLWRSTILQGVT